MDGGDGGRGVTTNSTTAMDASMAAAAGRGIHERGSSLLTSGGGGGEVGQPRAAQRKGRSARASAGEAKALEKNATINPWGKGLERESAGKARARGWRWGGERGGTAKEGTPEQRRMERVGQSVRQTSGGRWSPEHDDGHFGVDRAGEAGSGQRVDRAREAGSGWRVDRAGEARLGWRGGWRL